MSRYNRFGAVFTDVVELYPGTVTADYGSQTAIENAMDRAVNEIAAGFSPNLFRQMTKIEAEQVVIYATAGQTTFSVGLTPVVANTIHVWRYPSLASFEGPFAYSVTQLGDFYFRKPIRGVNEVLSTDYGINVTTGLITLTGSLSAGLNLGERVYATYDANMDAATFSLESVQDAVVIGAAAELGSKLFAQDSQTWKLVTDYQKRWADWLALIRTNGWIPDEVRRLTYWTEVERSSGQAGSVRLYRS